MLTWKPSSKRAGRRSAGQRPNCARRCGRSLACSFLSLRRSGPSSQWCIRDSWRIPELPDVVSSNGNCGSNLIQAARIVTVVSDVIDAFVITPGLAVTRGCGRTRPQRACSPSLITLTGQACSSACPSPISSWPARERSPQITTAMVMPRGRTGTPSSPPRSPGHNEVR